jgi:hypothetical protein
VTITGQTKSGKTVLTKKIYSKDESIWIDGGAIKTEEDFWNALLDKLEYYQTETFSKSTEGYGSTSSEDLVKGELAGFGGSKKVTTTGGDRTAETISVSTKMSAIKGLENDKIPLIIDDFHYIERTIQATIVRALKSPIFDGAPVIIIAIPHKRFDAMKVEKEMTGRISQIQIPMWSEEELMFIAETGFKLLNIEVDKKIIEYLSKEAVGSPHLMQEFCRSISKKIESGVTIEKTIIESIFHDIAENIGRPIFEKLMKGPRQRTDRIQRVLKNGKTVDIYGLILSALAHIKPGLISIEYEELRQAIREVISSQLPQIHEIARVLKTMSRIAATDESSAPVIDFDDAEKKLHITDPFFSFYLKWGNL